MIDVTFPPRATTALLEGRPELSVKRTAKMCMAVMCMAAMCMAEPRGLEEQGNGAA